jgi:hypothetical protein
MRLCLLGQGLTTFAKNTVHQSDYTLEPHFQLAAPSRRAPWTLNCCGAAPVLGLRPPWCLPQIKGTGVPFPSPNTMEYTHLEMGFYFVRNIFEKSVCRLKKLFF